MFLKVFAEFLIGRSLVPGNGVLGSFQVKRPSQLLKAQVGGVLVGELFVNKRLIGDRKRKLTVFCLGGYNTVKVAAAPGHQLKSQVLYLQGCHFFPMGASVRARSMRGRGRKAIVILKLDHLFCLQPLGALGDRKFHRLTFGKGFETLCLNG